MGELVEVDVFDPFRKVSGFESADFKKVIDQAKEAGAIFGEGFDVTSGPGEFAEAGDERELFDGAENQGKGGAKFVAHVGVEAGLGFGERLKLFVVVGEGLAIGFDFLAKVVFPVTEIGGEVAGKGRESGRGDNEVDGIEIFSESSAERHEDQGVGGEGEKSVEEAVDESPSQNHRGDHHDQAESLPVRAHGVTAVSDHPENHDGRNQGGTVGEGDDGPRTGCLKRNEEKSEEDGGNEPNSAEEEKVVGKEPEVGDDPEGNEQNPGLDDAAAVFGSDREFVGLEGFVGVPERMVGAGVMGRCLGIAQGTYGKGVSIRGKDGFFLFVRNILCE